MTEVNQLNVIEEFKLNREELEEHIKSLEEEIRRREEVNQSQLEQQDREQVEGKNKYGITVIFSRVSHISCNSSNKISHIQQSHYCTFPLYIDFSWR